MAAATNVSSPTLIVVGDQDEFGATEAAPAIARGIHGAELITLKSAERGTSLLVGAHAREVTAKVNEYLAK